MWSVGCILVEILIGYVPFRGKDEMDQITQIYKVLGTATDETWKGVNKLKYYSKSLGKQMYHENHLKKDLEERFEGSVVDLIMKMLCYDPKKRITAEDSPIMCKNNGMPKFSHDFHELDLNGGLDFNKVGNITHLLNEKMMVGKYYITERGNSNYSSRQMKDNSNDVSNDDYYVHDQSKNSTSEKSKDYNYLSIKRKNSHNILL